MIECGKANVAESEEELEKVNDLQCILVSTRRASRNGEAKNLRERHAPRVAQAPRGGVTISSHV